MSNAELNAMLSREQLFRSVLLPIAVVLIFGWAIFNGRQQRPEQFDLSVLDGCYTSARGLSARIEDGLLHVSPGPKRDFAFVIERGKIGLTIVPEMTITVESGDQGFAARATRHEEARWVPNVTLRNFSRENRYTVVDLEKANGFTMLKQSDSSDIDFYRELSCER